MATVEQVAFMLDQKMKQIERILPKGRYKLTLVCRYVADNKLDADMLFTLDDLDKVIEVINKLKDREPLVKGNG